MISAAVKMAQQRLQALGISIGKAGVDGQLGNDTRAAVRAFQKRTGLPVTGLLTDATMQALAKPQAAPAAPPMPRPRPEPDRLGTGNTDTNPRLRPQEAQSVLPARIQEGQPSGPRMPMAPMGGQRPDMSARPDQAGGGLPHGLEGAQLADARANLNPDVHFAPGTTFDSIFRREQTGNARTREAQAITGPLKYQQRTGPPQVGTMIDTPFADRWNDTNPLPQNSPQNSAELQGAEWGGRMGGQNSPQSPDFTPTPGNPGYGLPGMPQRSTFGQAAGDVAGGVGNALNQMLGVTPAQGGPDMPSPQPQPMDEAAQRQALEKAIWDAIVGLRIQQQPNEPAYSDQYATPRTEPSFTSPMGAYR